MYKVIAGVGERGAVGACFPSASSPVATEVCVEDLEPGRLISVSIVERSDGFNGARAVRREGGRQSWMTDAK